MAESKLTKVQAVALNELAYTNEKRAWATPHEAGVDSSDLGSLVRKGLVEFKQRGAPDSMIGFGPRAFGMSRGSKCYRITPAGRAALRQQGGSEQ